jgi:hypothetical protein
MLSEENPRVARALQAVAPQHAAYHRFVLNELGRLKSITAAGESNKVERVERELGALGAAHIDLGRFAELARGASHDSTARARIDRAVEVLTQISKATIRDFAIEVAEWRSVSSVVASALGHWGRAFGAAISADLARVDQYDPAHHDALTQLFSFDRWNKAYRNHAPPIVALIDDGSTHVADLSDVMDGDTHIVLVMKEGTAPSGLVRLITPHTLVLQTSDERGLDRFANYNGPAIAALVGEHAAAFLHDPAAGIAPWQRLSIWRHAAEGPRKTLGGLSPTQQREEVLQLEALAAQPALPAGALEALGGASGNPADRLASWLLAQSQTTS